MSSHREAPGISQDPVADNTDLYAFVSPDKSNTVTIIANYIPLEYPAGGPNFFEFGDDVRYQIHIDNNGDGAPDVTYAFDFTTKLRNPETFLYNTGPIASLKSTSWNRRQFYTVTRWENGKGTVIAKDLPCPPCNIGPRSTPNYEALANKAIHKLPSGETIFAGQRDDGFYVDLGSIFDLADLRPFQNLHLIPTAAAPGVDNVRGFSVHSIAIQVPKKLLSRTGGTPSDPSKPAAVVGVWASASRRKATMRDAGGKTVSSGPYVQVSRLGNPLFNEVVVPMGHKDRWNSLTPRADGQFLHYVEHPELAKLLPILYPGVFPHLAGLTGARADLAAILLTGLPAGIVSGFQNFTGPRPADQLRLNMAIAPSSSPNIMGILGGDLAGFPNGRRVQDNVVAIELQAIAGVTYPLVNPSYTPDGAASLVNDGTSPASNPINFLPKFPYLGVPRSGFDSQPPK